MIFKDEGYGITQDSLDFFRQHKDQIGNVVSVEMMEYYTDDGEWVYWPFRIKGTEGEIWLSGCVTGYGGEGPRGTQMVLRELGYSAGDCKLPLVVGEFKLGPPT